LRVRRQNGSSSCIEFQAFVTVSWNPSRRIQYCSKWKRPGAGGLWGAVQEQGQWSECAVVRQQRKQSVCASSQSDVHRTRSSQTSVGMSRSLDQVYMRDASM
jgi:hypothetical protein